MNASERALFVKQRALELGFGATGIADLSPNAHGEHFLRWLSAGMAGVMTYMHRQAKRRLDPSSILPGATRAVVVMRNHFSVDALRRAGTGRVAKYARGPDYHDVLLRPLLKLTEYVKSLGNADTIARAYVDAGPVPERELAQRAGLGWIGKNTMLINPDLGSHHFLATVLTNLDVALDAPFTSDRCGSCQRCLDSCPTDAIQTDRMLDSRLCISYLTIEYTGEIAEELQRRMGDWIFGCDACQDVCPWNVKFATSANDPLLLNDPCLGEEDLEFLCNLTPEQFDRRFAKTPLERSGLEGIRRNAQIVRQNARTDDEGA